MSHINRRSSFGPGEIVEFSINAPDAWKVEIAGSFNGWTLMELHKYGLFWRKELYLEPGWYQYKFFIDNWRWENDNPKLRSPDGYGGFNAVVHVSDHSWILEEERKKRRQRQTPPMPTYRHYSHPGPSIDFLYYKPILPTENQEPYEG